MTPRLLDLFCCAGGAATGYHRAGFEVVGVDIADRSASYPFEFHQADATTFPLDGFDAVHASPPCQHYAAVTRWRGSADDHPDLVPVMRERLSAWGGPWIMENVREADLRGAIMLCGSHFGLKVRRHRYFEAPALPLVMTPPCRHHGLLPFMHKGERAYADAMGCTWMSAHDAREAIPPAYTELLGRHLLDLVEARRAA